MTKVLMIPSINSFENNESGIKRVVEAYFIYGRKFGLEFVECKPSETDWYDVALIHAGIETNIPPGKPVVSVLHGLYWTADYTAARWEWGANASVIASMRRADQITVPSRWVAETVQRDFRVNPHILPHGIEAEEWDHNEENRGYVLWNKNRDADVCNPEAVGVLALSRKNIRFVTTFLPKEEKYKSASNILVTGVIPHSDMKLTVQRAGVYLSTTKETFGIGVLEAMASGVPVLGFAHGGNVDLVKHGVNGYLARPGDYDDLLAGLDYCIRYREILGENGKKMAREWTWEKAAEKLAVVIEKATHQDDPTVSIIIPTYNYAEKVARAIDSASKQTYPLLKNIVVVDDGSQDDGATREIVKKLSKIDKRVKYIYKDNEGVAIARNHGIESVDTKYVCCLDADDALDPRFVEVCVDALEKDNTLGIAYTGLTYIKPDGETGLSTWPAESNYDKQLSRQNQIPTCCVYRREMWARLGGYKQRYAPEGAGSEDAEFWTRAGAYGWGARKVTDAGFFIYSWMSGRVSGNKEYREVDWLAWHPWVKDGKHPIASMAAPANGFSHPVRQYDQPIVSVIIPIGIGHEKFTIVESALDSLEAQTFRRWEAIVVFDGVDETSNDVKRLLKAYPYIRTVFLSKKSGAGKARNEGAKIARAPLLLFLDADDWLYPNALQRMTDEWGISNTIVYSDYVGKASISAEDIDKVKNRVLYYDIKRGEAVVEHHALPYDCQRAISQPRAEDVYIWCLVSSLIPKIWHDEVGGFDEKMVSWEDWDYWIRLAKSGKCFTRIPEPLVVYRFHTGSRREIGLHENRKLLQYLIEKHEEGKGVKTMPCGCSGGRQPSPTVSQRIPNASAAQESYKAMNDENMVLVVYTHPNRGQHKVIGPVTRTNYGYRGGGNRFYVDKRDIAAAPHLFQPIQQVEQAVAAVQQKPVEEVKAPEKITEAEAQPEKPKPQPKKQIETLVDVQGISQRIAMKLNEIGIHTVEDLIAADLETLYKVEGVGKSRLKAMQENAKQGNL